MSALVLLHGFLGLPSHFASVRAFLPQNASVSAPILPGHGLAARAGEPDGWRGAVEALAGDVPAGAVLAGYSLGARLALGIAASRADLAALVLISGHPGLLDDEERQERRAADLDKANQAETAGMIAFADAWGREPIVALHAASEPDRLARAEARRSHDAGSVAWSLRALGLGSMPYLGDALRSRPYPVTLVTGALDAKFTGIASAFAGKGVVHQVVPHAGHDVALDAPELLAGILTAVLASSSRRESPQRKESRHE